MGTYFKPLRRKVGVVTLLMACVFTGLWMRSYILLDVFYVHVPVFDEFEIRSGPGWISFDQMRSKIERNDFVWALYSDKVANLNPGATVLPGRYPIWISSVEGFDGAWGSSAYSRYDVVVLALTLLRVAFA